MVWTAEVTTKGLTDKLTEATDRIDSATAEAVFMTGAALLTLVRAKARTGFHAPGKPHIEGTGPGPNQATGDYVRSIHQTNGYEGSSPVSIVSTDAPQAARLEYGFPVVMVDSFGRHFTQPPYPHWRPAAEEIEPILRANVADAVRKALL